MRASDNSLSKRLTSYKISLFQLANKVAWMTRIMLTFMPHSKLLTKVRLNQPGNLAYFNKRNLYQKTRNIALLFGTLFL